MLSDQKEDKEGKPVLSKSENRRQYRKPKLEKLGDLRLFTLGPTPGLGESASPTTLKGA